MDNFKLMNDNENATAIAGLNGAMENILDYPRWNLGLFNLERNKKILDIGCGPGLSFDSLIDYSPALYVGADFSEVFLNQFRTRLDQKNQSVELFQLDITNIESVIRLFNYQYDYVLCFDVLEHIEDDEHALKNLRVLLQNTGNGKLCIRVPALPAIYGENDKAIGHFRRYSKDYLVTVLAKCGFTIHTLGYQNLPGAFFWFATGKLFKRAAAVTNSESKLINKMIPLIAKIEKSVHPPFGSSLYCTCSA